MPEARQCPVCRGPASEGAAQCPGCGHCFTPAPDRAAGPQTNGRRAAPPAGRSGGGRWLLVIGLVVALAVIPGLVDLSSLLVKAGPDRPALERSRRAEALFRTELPKAGLKPVSVERRGQWSVRVTLPRGWEALSEAEKRRTVESYGQLWTDSMSAAGARPGDRATWLFIANEGGRIVGGWDPQRGVHVDE